MGADLYRYIGFGKATIDGEPVPSMEGWTFELTPGVTPYDEARDVELRGSIRMDSTLTFEIPSIELPPKVYAQFVQTMMKAYLVLDALPLADDQMRWEDDGGPPFPEPPTHIIEGEIRTYG